MSEKTLDVKRLVVKIQLSRYCLRLSRSIAKGCAGFKKNFGTILQCQHVSLREGCGKSKWKFKMAFAMKGGGGVSRGSRLPLSYFEK